MITTGRIIHKSEYLGIRMIEMPFIYKYVRYFVK